MNQMTPVKRANTALPPQLSRLLPRLRRLSEADRVTLLAHLFETQKTAAAKTLVMKLRMRLAQETAPADRPDHTDRDAPPTPHADVEDAIVLDGPNQPTIEAPRTDDTPDSEARGSTFALSEKSEPELSDEPDFDGTTRLAAMALPSGGGA